MNPKWQALNPGLGIIQALTLACLALDSQAQAADKDTRQELAAARRELVRLKRNQVRQAQARARRRP